jgi:hypothetical protein
MDLSCPLWRGVLGPEVVPKGKRGTVHGLAGQYGPNSFNFVHLFLLRVIRIEHGA